MVHVAIMGYGVVGSGVAEVLLKNARNITHKAGKSIKIRRILDLKDFPDSPLADCFTKHFEDILNDSDIRIVVETMGGLNPAYDFVRQCLLAGKSVITSNKELVAAKGDELLALAQERNLNFLFEASVGGGIPILRPLDQCLAANEVYEIMGILNGTTNFILTKMIQDGASFEDALEQAQRLGYAERDPSADVDGHDTCRKICILASLAFGKHVYPEQVPVQGIGGITLDDVKYAAAWGGVIKLIGQVKKREDGRLDCLVAPMILPQNSRLAEVNDVFNGILVRGDAIGDVVFYGQGAGKLPTASAVVADIIDAVRHTETRKPLYWAPGRREPGSPDYIADYRAAQAAFLLRFQGGSAEQAKGILDSALGACRLIVLEDAPADAFALVTPSLPESLLKDTLKDVKETTLVSQIRIAD